MVLFCCKPLITILLYSLPPIFFSCQYPNRKDILFLFNAVFVIQYSIKVVGIKIKREGGRVQEWDPWVGIKLVWFNGWVP